MTVRSLSAVVVVSIVALGGAGFVLGKNQAPTQADAAGARAQALATARADTEDAARATALREGLHAGRREGMNTGRRMGTEEGEAAAEAEIERETAADERVAAEAEPAPGTAGSDVCVTYQDYVPGVGCVPPVAPGETAAPIDCPPGQVPAGTTGACGRP